MTYRLRPAHDADFLFMRDTKLEGMRPYVEAVWGWDLAEQQRRFADKFDAAASRIVVSSGADVGWIHVVESDRAMFLAGIYLAAATRRRGIGSAIIHDLIDRSVRQHKSLGLRVLKVNPAQRLYQRMGFATTGETATHFLMMWSPSSR